MYSRSRSRALVQSLESRQLLSTAMPLPAPIDVSASVVTDPMGDRVAQVSWLLLNKRESGFRVEQMRDDRPGFDWKPVATAPVDATKVQFPLPAGGIKFRYRVIATGKVDSSPSEVTPRLNVLGPSSPMNLTISSPDPKVVRLSWTDISSDESRFRVERRDSADAEWHILGMTGGASDPYRPFTGYTDSSVVGGWSYQYRVITLRDSDGRPNFSNVAAIVTPAAKITSLSAPTHVNATRETDGVMLRWRDTTLFEDSYKVQRREAGSTRWISIVEIGVNAQLWFDGTANAGKSYEYRVEAIGYDAGVYANSKSVSV